MKIHQLPLGARFIYEDKEYVKTGPLFASSNGEQRFIPKYAVLKPLDEIEQPREPVQSDFLPRASVLKAFAAFYADCEHCVPDHQQTALNAAREAFLEALN